MFVAVDSKSFPVTNLAPEFWIVNNINAPKSAMKEPVLHVELAELIDVNVEVKKRKEIVVIGISSVRIPAQIFSIAENISARKVVILEIVENVLFKGRGLVLVEKECMKECLAMLQRLFVVELVENCCIVVTIGVLSGVIEGIVLKRVGLWLLSLVGVEDRRKRFLAFKICRARGSVRE